MLLKGLDEIAFGVFNSMDDETVKSVYLMNNQTGGPTQFQVQNTSPTVTQVYAGDALFRVSGKGNGQITSTIAIEDIPAETLHALLGYEKDKDSGLWVVGKDTALVAGCVYARSHDANDQKAWIGLLKGVFTRGDINPQTNQAQETDATDSLTFTAMNRAADGYAYFEGLESENVTEESVQKFVFPNFTGKVNDGIETSGANNAPGSGATGSGAASSAAASSAS
ncbi:phage tail protein [Pediococcus inopinatus]|uniref:major tail protein n=1 Tax=Pediococcus inopinatus TaxID=114090 RepID=UPI002B258B55|nr:major tail protein [Pediococcus inopinatus]WPC19421.1 phage tail protein [Pediococcus inopinatus]